MEDWKESKLGEVLTDKGYIRGPFGSALKRGDMKDSGIPVYEQQHAIYQSRDFRFYIDENKFNEMKRFQVQTNDLVISCSGTVGKVTIIDENDPKGIISQALLILRVNSEIILPKYLQYFFTSENGYNSIISRSSGSVQVNIAKRDVIEGIPLYLPPLPTQQKIAQILSSLDDKIELNNKINANLEQQAQALFKSWFVDFENSSDFTEKKLDEVTVNLRERILDQNTPVLSAVNTGCLQRSDDYFSKQVYSKDISKYILVKIGDFAYNPARINIGSIGINDFDYDGCVSPVYVAFSVDPSYKSFFKYYFKSNSFKEETKTRASGSVRQSLNYDDFAKIQINYPSRELASKFEEFYTSIESSIKRIKKENETLISIRDTLLPKLMNGEIEVI